MKIKFRQLSKEERTLIANALLEYTHNDMNAHLVSAEIMNGEVILGQYQYNKPESIWN